MATTTEQKPEQGLATAAVRVVQGEIVTAEAYNARVAAWRDEGYNVLTPAVALSTIPRDHKILVQSVQINPSTAGGEVYQNGLFTKAGEVALSKTGLEKIAQAAGISIDESVRVDSRTVEFVWSYRVRGHWIGFDSTRIDRIATKTLDLRNGSPDIKGFTANQIEQARRHGEAVCESKAINRLYRQYGLRQKYTERELQAKPFIVLKLQWEPDMSNPVVAAIVTQLKMGSVNLLYPQGMPGAVDPASLPPHQVPPELRPPGEAQHVESDDDDPPADRRERPAQQSASEIETIPPADEPAKRYTITRVAKQVVDGTARFFIATEQTFDSLIEAPEPIAMAAAAAKKAGHQVELDLERTASGMRAVEMCVVAPPAAVELPGDARFVVDVREKAGKTNGRDWIKFTVVFKDGTEASTFSASIAKDARDAKAGNLPVRATLSTSEKYPDQQNVEELSIIDTRQGTLPMTTDL